MSATTMTIADLGSHVLTDKEKYALRMVTREQPMTVAQLAREMGVSKQRASTLVKRARQKLSALREMHIKSATGNDFETITQELVAA